MRVSNSFMSWKCNGSHDYKTADCLMIFFLLYLVLSHLWTKLHQLGDSKLFQQGHLMVCHTRALPLPWLMAVIMHNCILHLGLQAATYKNMPFQSGLGSLNVNITWRPEPVNMEQFANIIILNTSVDQSLTTCWALWVFPCVLWVDLMHVFIQETSMLSTWNIIHIGFHPSITSVHFIAWYNLIDNLHLICVQGDLFFWPISHAFCLP